MGAPDTAASVEWAGLTPFRLVELDAPLRPVEFPTGAVRPVVAFDKGAHALERDWRTAAQAGDRRTAGVCFLALLRRCVPEATEEDLASLAPHHGVAIVQHARHQLDAVLAEAETRRGNADALTPVAIRATPPATPRSRRTTTRAPWWRAWRGRSAATTGR